MSLSTLVSTPRCGRGNRSSNLRQGTYLYFLFIFGYVVLCSPNSGHGVANRNAAAATPGPGRAGLGEGTVTMMPVIIMIAVTRPTSPSAIAMIQLPGVTTLTTRPCAPDRTQPPPAPPSRRRAATQENILGRIKIFKVRIASSDSLADGIEIETTN